MIFPVRPACSVFFSLFFLSGMAATASVPPEPKPAIVGYFRSPALQGESILFTAEGDLWKVPVGGGTAQRLTSHPRTEIGSAVSPDGKWVAFTASYEGPSEVYVMALSGGVPVRCTFENASPEVAGWTSEGKILYATSRYSTLPNTQLCTVDPLTKKQERIPLEQAADGCYDTSGKTLFFTRLRFQGSHTKRYKGGTAQNLWRWDKDKPEATPLTADFAGTSKRPLFWNGRVYFASDRDGVMNIWSMNPEGKDLRQHTYHTDFDVQSPSLRDGRIVYQCGADIYLLDIASGDDRQVPIRLASDFDQMRERWVRNPADWVTSAHLSNDGKKVAFTARGQIFVAPARQGRLVEVTHKKRVRYRDARFLQGSDTLVSLSDESGEVELWKMRAVGDGDSAAEVLTKDSTILRWETRPSPDGKWIAHTDKNNRLFLYSVVDQTNKEIARSDYGGASDLLWSSDSRYLVYVQPGANALERVRLYSVETGATVDLTTDRYASYSPAFSADGKFLYFLSDRRFESVVGSPWGARQPEPFFDKQTQVFSLALRPGLRSPFLPDTELTETAEEKKSDGADADKEKKDEKPEPQKPPMIDTAGIVGRLTQVPIAAGNYGRLAVSGDHLFFLSFATGQGGSGTLQSVAIRNENIKADTVLDGVNSYEISGNGKKMLVQKGSEFYVFDANGSAPNLGESRVRLEGWSFSFDQRDEWRQMFDEAWRLHRDYLYAPNMQAVDWKAMREKYRPLAERVTDRGELSDALAQMTGEVSLLHTFVYGGETRPGTDSVEIASLGAEWTPEAGGCRITRLYQADTDTPTEVGPLLQPGVEMAVGDVVTHLNGTPLAGVSDPNALLRGLVGRQVRLRVLANGDRARGRDVIVVPISSGEARHLRYNDWELSRRKMTDERSGARIGYVHLRAMGSGDIAQWQRDYYPVFNREGLIIDVRHNGGGNIDSWILEKLQRKAWMFWNDRAGAPTWNMQYAFRGPIVVLCDENTGSDGEAFSEGFKRLGLGKVIGKRTWGGEVWLTSSNTLVDNGVATAAEFGVFGPEGKWLIEGHGVEPDIVVDNLPRATFDGKDAQLEAAIQFLQEELKKHPLPKVTVPPFPDRSFTPKKR